MKTLARLIIMLGIGLAFPGTWIMLLGEKLLTREIKKEQTDVQL
jgi:hypothetical protein